MSVSLARPALRSSHRTGVLLLLASAAIWGLNWPVMKFLVGELPPTTIRASTGIAGAVLAFLAARWQQEPGGIPVAMLPRLVLLSLLNITSWLGLATLALLWLPTSEAAILSYTMPVWSIFFAWPILGERPSAMRVGGLALSLAGCILLVAGQPLQASRAELPGILLILAASILFALGTVLSKRLPLPLPPVTNTAWQLLLGSLPLVAVAFALDRPWQLHVTPLAWAALFWSALFALCLGYLAWFGALARLPASTSAIGTLLIPVVAVLAATLLLGEPLGLRQLAALALTLTGVALATRA